MPWTGPGPRRRGSRSTESALPDEARYIVSLMLDSDWLSSPGLTGRSSNHRAPSGRGRFSTCRAGVTGCSAFAEHDIVVNDPSESIYYDLAAPLAGGSVGFANSRR